MAAPATISTPSLIEKATNSTEQEVNQRILKAIKSAARSSDEEISAAVDALMEQMKKPHSQVRYLSVLICDELFMRSCLFRSLFVSNLDHFLSLSVGFRKSHPLPPPSSIATNLRSKSIELLEKWNATFGIHYKQLRLGFDYLKNTLKYQFPNCIENAARLQQERRERQLRTMEILISKFDYLKENFASIKSNIQSTVREIQECLKIVNIEGDPQLSIDSDAFEELNSLSLRRIRLQSLKEGEKVQENSENKAIFDALRESYKLLVSKHLPSVQELTSVLVRVDAVDNRFRDSALKDFIDIRNLIQSLTMKCTELGITSNPNIVQAEEDLWEDGKIESYEPDRATSISTAATTESAVKSSTNARFPRESNSFDCDIASSTSDRKKLLKEAPLLAWSPFVFDNWGAKRDALANQSGLEVEGHWGRVDPDAVIPAEKIAELNVHCSVYKELPVEILPCLAPLKKGGLCQRRDLKICPFHGPIIPRDNDGIPIKEDFPAAICDKQLIEENNKQTLGQNTGPELIEHLASQATKNVHERDREEKALKRAKIAKVRKHNEEVLRDAAMASTSYSELLGTGVSAMEKKASLASMLKKKVTAKERIAQRLLSSQATDASSRQLTLGDDSKYREAFPNQWSAN